MNPWDEQAYQEINDLDAARLAIRGALATIRDLQDLNVRLKGTLQEAGNKEKLLQQERAELTKQLEGWREQEGEWERERQKRLQDENLWRDRLRLEVREEERGRVEADRRRMQEELARLTSSMEEWRAVQKDKEDKWRQLKALLEQREAELLAARREKIEAVNRFHQDSEMVARLRQKRDEEIISGIKAREADVESSQREILELKRKNEELARALAAAAQDSELKLHEREEVLVREYRARELALQEKYSGREAQLQAAWAELENGLWKRSKEAREKLDQTAAAQFDERARSLADRSREVEALLERRQKELDSEFQARISELEGRYAKLERDLADSWKRKEAQFIERFETELLKEKQLLSDRAAEAAREFDERKADLPREAERLRKTLEAEFASRQADSEVALHQKEKELEEAFSRRNVELQEAFLRKENGLREEWTQRKVRLLEEHEAAVEQERASLQAELKSRERALEEAYAARAAELERSQRALEEQFKSWKASILSDHLLKEKNLEKQWQVREAELVRRCETGIDQARRAASLELEKSREEFDRMRRLAEEDFTRRAQELKAGCRAVEGDLLEKQAKALAEAQDRHAAQILALRRSQEEALAAQAGRLQEQGLLREEESKRALQELKERHQSQLLEAEGKLAQKELELKRVKEVIARLDGDKAAQWEEIRSLRVENDAERAKLEARSAQIESRAREVEARGQALEEQGKRFAETISELESQRQAERDRHAAELAGVRESLQGAIEEARKEAAQAAAKEKEEWLERQRKSLIRERDQLKEQAKAEADILAAEASRREAEFAQRREALDAQSRKKEEELGQQAAAREKRLVQEQAELLARERAALDSLHRSREQAQHAKYLELEGQLSAQWRQKTQAAEVEAAEKLKTALKAKEEELAAAFAQRLAAEQAALQEAAQRRARELEERHELVERHSREKEARLDKSHAERAQALEKQWLEREAELLHELDEERSSSRARHRLEIERLRSELRELEAQLDEARRGKSP